MSEFNVSNLVDFALEKQPEKFHNAFSDIMADKINAAVEVRKKELAQEYMSDDAEEDSSEDEVTEIETEEQDGQDTETNS